MPPLLRPVLLLLLPAVFAIDACTVALHDFTCEHPDGDLDPCDRRECPGECLPLGPYRRVPVLLWIGPLAEAAPECPARAPDTIKEGYADLTWSHECAPCACEQPTGSCELPTTFAANAALCPATGAEKTSFNAPAGWDGTCDTSTMIPKDEPCTAGPCVQSLSIDPIIMKQSGCMRTADPVPTTAPFPSIPEWKTFMRACFGQVLEDAQPCGDPDLYCVPSSEPPPPGFSQCIEVAAGEACPAEYPDARVLYAPWGYNDSRWCTECHCGPPVGSFCWSGIQIYSTNDCSGVPWFGGGFTSDPAPCSPAALGAAVGSKEATPPVYTPGTCEPSGGEKIGTVEPVDPIAAFCCQSAVK